MLSELEKGINTRIELIEKKKPISFHKSYIDFIIKHKGNELLPHNCIVELWEYDKKNINTNKSIEIEKFFSLSELESILQYCDEYFKEELIPIANILGDMSICISYENNYQGFIYYHDFDFGKIFLAEDINAFIDSL